jgi:vacuolar-type H+-ATPase subunit H
MPVAAVRDDPLRELIATESAVQGVLADARLRAEGIIEAARQSAARLDAELDAQLSETRGARTSTLEQELEESLAALEAVTARSIERLHSLDDATLDRLADLALGAVVTAAEARTT